LNLAELDRCAGGPAAEAVRADLQAARDLGLRSTPSLLLGKLIPGGVRVTKVISGAIPAPDLSHEIDALLRAPTSAGRE